MRVYPKPMRQCDMLVCVHENRRSDDGSNQMTEDVDGFTMRLA